MEEGSTQCTDLFLHTWFKRGTPSENPPGAGQPTPPPPSPERRTAGRPRRCCAAAAAERGRVPGLPRAAAGRRGGLAALATSRAFPELKPGTSPPTSPPPPPPPSPSPKFESNQSMARAGKTDQKKLFPPRPPLTDSTAPRVRQRLRRRKGCVGPAVANPLGRDRARGR